MNMGKFSEHLDLRHIRVNKQYEWSLLSDLVYTTSSGRVITVPVGFVTDLASIPRVLWPILPPFWSYAKAAVIHDYLLVNKEPPSSANSIFNEGMKSLGVNKVQRVVIYGAVQVYFFFKPYWIKFKTLFSRSH